MRANLQIFQEFFWQVVKIKNYIIETCDYISYIKEATLNIYHFIMILLCLSIICALEVISTYNNHRVKILCNGHCTFLPGTAFCDVILVAGNWLSSHHCSFPYSHPYVKQSQYGSSRSFIGAVNKVQCIKCSTTC